MKANIEAVADIRQHVALYGSEITDRGGERPVAIGMQKFESLQTGVEGFGVVSGLVACRALVVLPGAEERFGSHSPCALQLNTQLAWGLDATPTQPSEYHESASTYLLETSDPATIDACFRALRRDLPEADVNDLPADKIPEELRAIKMQYRQEIPDGSRLEPADRKRVIRAFKATFPYLTIISTSTGGNVHDDEIPLLAEWLVA